MERCHFPTAPGGGDRVPGQGQGKGQGKGSGLDSPLRNREKCSSCGVSYVRATCGEVARPQCRGEVIARVHSGQEGVRNSHIGVDPAALRCTGVGLGVGVAGWKAPGEERATRGRAHPGGGVGAAKLGSLGPDAVDVRRQRWVGGKAAEFGAVSGAAASPCCKMLGG